MIGEEEIEKKKLACVDWPRVETGKYERKKNVRVGVGYLVLGRAVRRLDSFLATTAVTGNIFGNIITIWTIT